MEGKVEEKVVGVTVLLRGCGRNREETWKKYVGSLEEIHTTCYKTITTNDKGTNK